MRRTCLALFAAAGLAVPAAAQPSISASIAPGITSMTGDEDAERNVTASASFQQLLRSERVRIFYDLDTGDFATPGDWRFLSQSAGGSYRFDFGPRGSHHVYAGADGTLRRNGDSWSAADFTAAGAFANIEFHPGVATVRTGYRLDLRRFPSSPSLDQLQNTAFGSLLVSFQTRTTFIAEVTVGTKYYQAISAQTEVIAVSTQHANDVGGPGSGRRRVGDVTLVPVVSVGAPGSNAQQVTVFGRVAQSLAERTGLMVEVSRRRVSGEVSPALVSTPANFFDDGIYDDLFASNATRRSVALKSIVGSAVELEASASSLDKNYGATYAFDENGLIVPGTLRADRVTLTAIAVSWPLFPSRTGPVSLELLGGYDYIRHRSTSALYRYTSHVVRLAIGVTY